MKKIMLAFLLSLSVGLFCNTEQTPTVNLSETAKASETAKVILVSFDGSGDLSMWRDTLDFANNNGVKLTYFISAPYFVSKDELIQHPYWAEQEVGSSPIHFREDTDAHKRHIKYRFDYLNIAHEEGHEIASHLGGHYCNTYKWTNDQWRKEFEFFNWAIGKGFDLSKIVGIRAPCLAVNNAYYDIAKEFCLKYDSSITSRHKQFSFQKMVPIRQIRIPEPYRTLMGVGSCIPFDYNFNEIAIKKGIITNGQQEEMFFESLKYDYLNGPSPMQICLHFERMADGEYIRAYERFVEWTKDKNPSYKTYKEAE